MTHYCIYSFSPNDSDSGLSPPCLSAPRRREERLCRRPGAAGAPCPPQCRPEPRAPQAPPRRPRPFVPAAAGDRARRDRAWNPPRRKCWAGAGRVGSRAGGGGGGPLWGGRTQGAFVSPRLEGQEPRPPSAHSGAGGGPPGGQCFAPPCPTPPYQPHPTPPPPRGAGERAAGWGRGWLRPSRLP